jgi:mono/diheme cytochrome c family protein
MQTSRSIKTLACLGAIGIVILGGSCQGSTTPTTATATLIEPGAPLVQFMTDNFVGSGNCAMCHSNLTTSNGANVSISTQWASTMMANAAKDPYFMAEVASMVNAFPSLDSTIEATCATCHMPMASTQAKANGTVSSILNTGFSNPSNPLYDAAMDGVSCSLCHQIEGSNMGQTTSFTGNYQIDTSATAPNRAEYGPYSDPLQTPMQNTVGFTPTQGAQISSSALCATCHTVFTPTINSQGSVTGSFPEQVTYLEWLNSMYGDNPSAQMTCQACHMPAASGPVAISNNPTTLTPRSPFYQHILAGGNVFMLDLMENNINSLGITASSSEMQATAQLTDAELAAAARISIASSGISGNTLNVTVNVADLAGHKFPTGFPSRLAWIQFTVTDSTGKVVFQSGKPNANGSISGDVADTNPGEYEPNYSTITSSNEVQIYEAIMGDSSGNVTYNLLSAAEYLKDNRLLPAGFDKATAASDVAVVGNALNDAGFVGGSDQVTYQVSLSGAGPYTITANLLYQSVSYQFMHNFQGSNAFISTFLAELTNANMTPQTVSSITQTIS